MADWVQIQMGDLMEKRELDPAHPLSIGEKCDCGYHLPPGSCGENLITFFFSHGKWRVRCSGQVTCNGQPVGEAEARNGELYLLNRKEHIAVRFLHQEHQPARKVPLGGSSQLLIGRADSCDLQLQNKRVSGSHAKLYFYEGGWYVCDMNSTNGTFLNGQKISSAPLRERDVLVVGPYELVFSAGGLEVSGGEPGSIQLRLPEQEERRQAGSRPAKGSSEGRRPARRNPAGSRPAEGDPAGNRAAGRCPDFSRSPRLIRQRPSGRMEIEGAPSIGSKPEINWLTTLLPVLGTLVISLAMSAFTGGIGMMLSVPMMLMGVVVTVINYKNQTKRFQNAENTRREKYQAYIRSCEKQLEEAARTQRDALLYANPGPEQCRDMARRVDPRLWERTAGDADFLSLRVGLGAEPLGVEVQTPKVGFVLEEDAFTRMPQQLADRYRLVDSVPVLCDLKNIPSLGVVGSRSLTVRMAQALAVQLATLHGYDEVRLAVIFPPAEWEQWAWMRWLPHTWNEDRTQRYLAGSRYEASQLFAGLEKVFQRRKAERGGLWGQTTSPLPHYVVLVADPSLLNGQPAAEELFAHPEGLGISWILLGQGISSLPGGIRQILEARGEESALYLRERTEEKRSFRMDQLSLADCDTFARSLAPVRLPEKSSAHALPEAVTLLEGYHVQRPDQLDLGEFWGNSCSYQSLSVPIGVRGGGSTYFFDIHEKASGPHGLVAGTNGSGKSEMAQSWIISMALQFPPSDVNFVLVDFKGSSLLKPFLELPHLAGSISNLDKDVRRCLLALDNEIERRQILVHQYDAHDILGYQARRRSHPEMEEMPFLILVIDEFADFKAQFPDFTGALDHIFRGGRSLGIYTVIMTQKPAGVVTEQMNANANFRWCLKVVSEHDSRDMLGISDAAYLTTPGRAYVKKGTARAELVQPFYSGAPYYPEGRGKHTGLSIARVELGGERQMLFSGEENNGLCAQGTQLEAVVQAIAAYCRRCRIPAARKIWAPPLPEKLELAEILPGRKLWEGPGDWAEKSAAPVAWLGLVDDPASQRQFPLSHPFREKGNLLVYGMPLSGKTTFLQTLLASLCSRYTPDQLQVYLMEFGGFGLRTLECFPHTGGAAGDDEPEILRKITGHFLQELERRKQLFRQQGAGSIGALEEAGGQTPASWILAADNLNLAGARFPDLVDDLVKISREGEAFGLYLAATVTGSNSPGYQLAQNFKTVMTLQLTDRTEYGSLVGRVTGDIPKPVLGRGLIRGPLEFQTAIAFSEYRDGQRTAALRQMAGQMAEAWQGELPRKIRSLPVHVPYGSVPGGPLILGLSREDASPVRLPLEETPGLLVSAGDEAAKERLLTLLLRQAAALPEVQILLYSRSFSWPGAEVLADPQALAAALQQLVPELRARQSARRAGSREGFPPIVLVVDDLDSCMQEAEPTVISQLEVFVRLGAGLNLTVVAADLADGVEHSYFSRNILLETLSQGPLLLTGGSPEDHRAVDVSALERQFGGTFGEDLLVLVQDGHFLGVKQMEATQA